MTYLSFQETFLQILELPQVAENSAFLKVIRSHFQKFPFLLKWVKQRNSKWGTYQWRGGVALITLNADLDPEAMLLTLLHEMAHGEVQLSYKRRQAPHGTAWKNAFRRLIEQALETKIFSPTLADILMQHKADPKASVGADKVLAAYLTRHRIESQYPKFQDLAIGTVFQLGKRVFKKTATAFALTASENKLYRIRKEAPCLIIQVPEADEQIPAAAFRDLPLFRAVEKELVTSNTLQDLPEGASFNFRGERYRLDKKRRSRAICTHLTTGKQYLISLAVVLG